MARALPVVKVWCLVLVGEADVGGGGGSVVDAVDGDRDGGRVGAAVAVTDRVGEVSVAVSPTARLSNWPLGS